MRWSAATHEASHASFLGGILPNGSQIGPPALGGLSLFSFFTMA